MSLEFFFNSSSVAGLTRLVLGAVIMLILLRGKSQTARLLGITFAGATVFNIFLLITDAMLPPFTDYLNPAETVPLLWIMIGLVPFAYYFPELVFKLEEAGARVFGRISDANTFAGKRLGFWHHQASPRVCAQRWFVVDLLRFCDDVSQLFARNFHVHEQADSQYVGCCVGCAGHCEQHYFAI